MVEKSTVPKYPCPKIPRSPLNLEIAYPIINYSYRLSPNQETSNVNKKYQSNLHDFEKGRRDERNQSKLQVFPF